MAVGDESATAGEKKPGIPIWVIVGGVAVVAFVLWRMRSAASSSTAQPLVPAVATDPNTGLPINPLTGLPWTGTTTTPPTITDWVNSAESWARQHHVGAGLASKALWDYTNGLAMNEAEQNFIQQVIKAIGYPSQLLPFRTKGAPNPVSPKGPYFHAPDWMYFNFGHTSDYAGEPKYIGAASKLMDVLGRVGGLITMPAKGAPIYALLPGGLLPNAQGYNPKAALRWRRIDALSAYALLPFGTRVATTQEYAA